MFHYEILLLLFIPLLRCSVTEHGVTEQVIVDHCCSVNANFIFEGLRVKPAVNFRKERRGL
jgi:hypothetical protein